MEIRVRQAREHEAEFLTELALRSKAHWPYLKEYLAGCRPILTITPQFIREWPVLVAEFAEGIAGFSALLAEEKKRLLDHLWVEPNRMGRGVGRRLFEAAVTAARNIGWLDFEIVSDPYAEPFYARMGAKRIGEVESKIQRGLFLPVMHYRLTPALEVLLRMGTEKDAESLVAVHHRAVREMASSHYGKDVIDAWTPPPNTEGLAAYRKRISSGEELTVVAQAEGEIVGFGAIVSTLNELRAVYVSPKVARVGVGTKILRRLEALAVECGLPELQLVSSLNAEPFYAINGYVSEGRGQHTLRSGLVMDCVKMKKRLDAQAS